MLRKRSLILGLSLLFVTTLTLAGCNANNVAHVNAKALNYNKISPILDKSKTTWIWSAEDIKDKTIISALKSANINTIYVNVGWEKKVKQLYLKENPKVYDNFIETATKGNITVEALYGNPDWTLTENYKDLKEQVDLVLIYNKNHKNKFNGIHLDIEPHALSQWNEKDKKNTDFYSRQYLENISKIKQVIIEHNNKFNDKISFNLDIPTWFIYYNLDNKNLGEEVIKIADEVTLMNYVKDNQKYIINAVKNFQACEKYNKKITIASEFQSNKEFSDVSLATLENKDFVSYFENANKDFEKYNSFKAFGIHDFKSLKEYLQN